MTDNATPQLVHLASRHHAGGLVSRRDDLRRHLWVKDTTARTRLADLTAEHTGKAARRNAVDDAL